MDVLVRGRHLELSEPLKAYATRRLRFSVGAFERRIAGVELSVADVNGPRGGIDKRCVIAAVVQPIGRVFARATDADAYAAIDRAAGRIRAVLVRRLDRSRDGRRRDAEPRTSG